MSTFDHFSSPEKPSATTENQVRLLSIRRKVVKEDSVETRLTAGGQRGVIP
jgi:hypothetical protein